MAAATPAPSRSLLALLTAISILAPASASAEVPPFAWGKALPATVLSFASSTTTAPDGSLWVSGLFGGTLDLDPGSGAPTLTSVTDYHDSFIAHYTAGGHLLWAGRLQYSSVGAITADGTGNVYLTGEFSGTVDIDPGPGVHELSGNAGGNGSGFVLKLDSGGGFEWAFPLISVGGQFLEPRGIAIAPSSRVAVTGDFSGTVDFDPGSGSTNLVAGPRDVFVCEYGADGSLIWARAFAGTADIERVSVAVSPAGDVLTTGSFAEIVDFDPGPDTHDISSSGALDVFLAKLDSNGSFVWAESVGSPTGDDRVQRLALDASGRILLTGTSAGTADFDPGPGVAQIDGSGFIVRYLADGSFDWVRGLGHPNGQCFPWAIASNGQGHSFTTGVFYGTVDLDPGPGTDIHSAPANHGAFLLELDEQGAFVGGAAFGTGSYGQSVSVGAQDRVFATGNFTGTVDLDPGPGALSFTSQGDGTGYITAFGGPANLPPDCGRVHPLESSLWPPNHELREVTLVGATDSDGDPVSIVATAVRQDESPATGPSCPDATITEAGQPSVRAERAGNGNGRVYTISYVASDGRGGSCEGTVQVGVPHSSGQPWVDDGPRFNSLGNCPDPEAPRIDSVKHAGGKATIDYSLPRASTVELSLYDLTGRRARSIDSGPRSSGTHSITWDTSGLPSGMYFSRLRVGAVTDSRAILISR